MGSFSYTPRDGIRLVIRRLGSLSYTSPAGISLVTWLVGSFPYNPVLESVCSFGGLEVSVTRPMLNFVRSFICKLSRRLVSGTLS